MFPLSQKRPPITKWTNGHFSLITACRNVLDKAGNSDHRRRRIVSVVQGAVTGLGSRVIGVSVSLLSVPLTIGYLGTERYGVWALLGSLLAWVRLADIGIGNGLTNAISHALGSERPDLIRGYISTAFAALSVISIALGLIVLLAWPWVDWNGLFRIHGELARAEVPPALMASIVIFLLSFPLSVIARTYNALQAGRLANYWAAGGNVASLAALFVVTHTHGGLVWLVIAVSGTGLAVELLSGVWLFTSHRPAVAPRFRSVRLDSARALLGVGVQFFLIQILALVVFQTDNLVIAHYLGAEYVPSYSVTYNLFGYTSLIQNILFTYVWVAYAEAISRRDIDWVHRTFRVNMIVSVGSTLVAVIPLLFVGRPFIKFWAGEAVVPTLDLVLWMGAWSLINAICSPISCLLAAASHLKAQVAYGAASAISNITLSIYLVQSCGATGAIAATVLSYLIFVCIPTSIDAKFLFKKLRHAV